MELVINMKGTTPLIASMILLPLQDSANTFLHLCPVVPVIELSWQCTQSKILLISMIAGSNLTQLLTTLPSDRKFICILVLRALHVRLNPKSHGQFNSRDK